MEPMIFDSPEPIIIPVTIGKKQYELREATEGAAAIYKDAILKSQKANEGTDGNRTVTFDKLNATEALLVSLCLFEKMDNGVYRPVPLSEVNGLVYRISNPLFKKAEEISGLIRKQTKEDIQKQITELQTKLNTLDNNGMEKQLKNSQSAILNTSD